MAYCVRLLCGAALMGVLATVSLCHAAPRKLSTESGQLLALASENFPNPTRAERALLEFADVENPDRGEWAVAGTSADPLDPSNDPQNSARWSKDRDIRARLLRWLCRDRAAIEKVDPRGIRILGAHLTGALDLSYLNVPFAIALIRCAISEPVNFESTEITRLDLDGCYAAAISAPSLHVLHDLSFGQPERARGEFRASGEVYLLGAKIGGYVWMVGAHFHRSKVEPHAWGTPFKMALVLNNAEVKSDIVMTRGFESDGAVLIFAATLGGDVNCAGGHFLNPGNIALGIDGSTSYGAELVGLPPFGPFEANGIVSMVGTHFSNVLVVDHAIFRGKLGEPHGLSAGGMTIRTAMVWQNVTLENDAMLDLGGASVGFLLDDQSSWPAPGKLLIDGLTYVGFGSAGDARTRLRWLRLQPGFHSQPYRQFANVLRQSGDDAGAIDVLIGEEDARYLNSPLLRRAWAGS
jgi:hypothetical protein